MPSWLGPPLFCFPERHAVETYLIFFLSLQNIGTGSWSTWCIWLCIMQARRFKMDNCQARPGCPSIKGWNKIGRQGAHCGHHEPPRDKATLALCGPHKVNLCISHSKRAWQAVQRQQQKEGRALDYAIARRPATSSWTHCPKLMPLPPRSASL